MTMSVDPLFAMGAPPRGASPWLQLVPFVLVLAIFYFIILLPMKRKQRKVQAFLDSLKVGDRVITTGGIYGQVTRLGEQSIQLQIADKIRIEVAKAAIGGRCFLYLPTNSPAKCWACSALPPFPQTKSFPPDRNEAQISSTAALISAPKSMACLTLILSSKICFMRCSIIMNLKKSDRYLLHILLGRGLKWLRPTS